MITTFAWSPLCRAPPGFDARHRRTADRMLPHCRAPASSVRRPGSNPEGDVIRLPLRFTASAERHLSVRRIDWEIPKVHRVGCHQEKAFSGQQRFPRALEICPTPAQPKMLTPVHEDRVAPGIQREYSARADKPLSKLEGCTILSFESQRPGGGRSNPSGKSARSRGEIIYHRVSRKTRCDAANILIILTLNRLHHLFGGGCFGTLLHLWLPDGPILRVCSVRDFSRLRSRRKRGRSTATLKADPRWVGSALSATAGHTRWAEISEW